MKAQETKLKALLEGVRQFAVPIYQRRYAWTTVDWTTAWAAIDRQASVLADGQAESRSPHFFGSFVSQHASALASEVTRYHVIDGQQRLTTIYVLLAAIRDLATDSAFRDRIHETYLVNKFQSGEDHFKLLPSRHDRFDLVAIVQGRTDDAKGPIGGAYQWFRNQLQLKVSGHDDVLTNYERSVINRLDIVDITVGVSDNAHRIFQTLNSTGKSLSQVDLLRNHFFMLMPNRTNEAYETLWDPMETLLGGRMKSFMWVDVVSRGGGRETVSTTGVYEQWKLDLEHLEDDEDAIFEELKALARRAHMYAQVVNPQLVTDAALRMRLERLLEWDIDLHHPVLLRAMNLMDRGVIASAEVADCCLWIESFLVRRLLTRTPTNNLNRIFTTVAGQLGDAEDLDSRLRYVLSGQGKYWPTDAELHAAALIEPFYRIQRPNQRQFVLRRLEEAYPGPEVPDWTACRYTIEHVMPQNLTQEWMEQLAAGGEEDVVAAHEVLLHTLGNCTLTCENPGLSDHPIERKREIYERSMLKMNRVLGGDGKWARDEIYERGQKLVDLAIDLWPGPVSVDTSTFDVELLRSVLGSIDVGSWASLNDVAELIDASMDDLLNFVTTNPQLPARDRLMRGDGSFETSFPWVSDNLDAYRLRLLNAGVIDNASASAAPDDRRTTSSELAELAGQ